MLRDLQEKFGETFTMRFPLQLGEIVITSNTDAIKEMFGMSADAAHAGEANVVLKPFLGQHSLLLLDGSEHMRQRKMILPAFHGERMHAYGKTMIEMTHDSIDEWPVGKRFPIHGRTQTITMQVILRTVFGIEEGPRFTELARLLKQGLDLAAWPGLLASLSDHAKRFRTIQPVGTLAAHPREDERAPSRRDPKSQSAKQ
jgi:cytochrome P450